MKRLIFLICFSLIATSALAANMFINQTGTVTSDKSINGTVASVQVTHTNYSGVARVYGSVDGVNYVQFGSYSSATKLDGSQIIVFPAGHACTKARVTQTYRYHLGTGATRGGRIGVGRADYNWR